MIRPATGILEHILRRDFLAEFNIVCHFSLARPAFSQFQKHPQRVYFKRENNVVRNEMGFLIDFNTIWILYNKKTCLSNIARSYENQLSFFKIDSTFHKNGI